MCFKKSPHRQKHKRDKTDFCFIRKKKKKMALGSKSLTGIVKKFSIVF